MNNHQLAIAVAGYFAAAAHAAVGQKRKYTGEPYHLHCQEVADILIDYNLPSHVVVAGLLHDTIEDSQITYETLVEWFGKPVADLVLEVTDVSKPEDGNRAVRKAIDLEHLKKASFNGKMIKLADMISNTKSIVEHDPGFARKYLKEKRAILVAFEDEMGNTELWKQAMKVLKDAEEKLKLY